VIGGWLPGQGSRSTTFASLLVGMYDDDGGLYCIGQGGSGFADPVLRRVRALLDRHARQDMPFAAEPELSPAPYRPPAAGPPAVGRPGDVCEVAYAELTETSRLRAPSYQGMRTETDPASCLLSTIAGRPS
jgi:bifunctional non-homologous end joining protein LigD